LGLKRVEVGEMAFFRGLRRTKGKKEGRGKRLKKKTI